MPNKATAPAKDQSFEPEFTNHAIRTAFTTSNGPVVLCIATEPVSVTNEEALDFAVRDTAETIAANPSLLQVFKNGKGEIVSITPILFIWHYPFAKTSEILNPVVETPFSLYNDDNGPCIQREENMHFLKIHCVFAGNDWKESNQEEVRLLGELYRNPNRTEAMEYLKDFDFPNVPEVQEALDHIAIAYHNLTAPEGDTL